MHTLARTVEIARAKDTLPFSRKAFTLIEIIVTMVVVAVLLTIVMIATTPESPNDRARVDAVKGGIEGLAKAIAGRNPSRAPTSFRDAIGAYPGKLSHLTTQILATTDKNICGTGYSGSAVPATPDAPGYALAWTNPFYYRQLGTSGTILAPGFSLQNALVLIGPTPSGTNGSDASTTMAMRMPSVLLRDAQALDLAVDGVIDGAAGAIIYNAAADPTQVDYYMPISGC